MPQPIVVTYETDDDGGQCQHPPGYQSAARGRVVVAMAIRRVVHTKLGRPVVRPELGRRVLVTERGACILGAEPGPRVRAFVVERCVRSHDPATLPDRNSSA